MRPLLAALALSLSALSAAPALAQEITAGDNVESILAARKGKQVTLRLSGGQELTGVVRLATQRIVVLGALSGREFFDAAVPLEKVEAVLVRTK